MSRCGPDGGGVLLAMNDSSCALRDPTLASRFQTFAASQFAGDCRTNKILHADVVLAGPNLQSLDQRTGQLRGQRVDRFVSFDTRARRSTKARPSAVGLWLGRRDCGRMTVYLNATPRGSMFASSDTVNRSEVAMLHTAPIRTAVSDLEQRGPGASTIGAGLAVATLLTVVYVGRAEALMMPALGMIAVTAAVIDARTLRIPNWLTGTGALTVAVLGVLLVVVEDAAWQPIAAGAAIMGVPLLVGTCRQQVADAWPRRRQARSGARCATRRSLTGRRVLGTAPGADDRCRVRTHLPEGDEASGVPPWPGDLVSIRLDSVRIWPDRLEWGVGVVIAIATDRLLPIFGCAPAHSRKES